MCSRCRRDFRGAPRREMWYHSNKVTCTDILRNKIPVAYLFFSPSFGLLIVNLQSDARKEFNGSIARRTPQAWKGLHATLSWWRKNSWCNSSSVERNTIDNGHKIGKTGTTTKISIHLKVIANGCHSRRGLKQSFLKAINTSNKALWSPEWMPGTLSVFLIL